MGAMVWFAIIGVPVLLIVTSGLIHWWYRKR
jgi:hypothetical protein